ncbi:MAG: hypothetical protein NVSMB58_33040 [Terriglobales bacterium]
MHRHLNIAAVIALAALTLPQAVHADPVALQPLNRFSCRALAPAGWSIVNGRAEGDSLDVMRSDQKAYAGYIIVGVPTVLRSNPAYASPAMAMHTNLQLLSASPVRLGNASQAYGYTVVPWTNARGRGFTMYRVFPLAADPGGFVLAMRTASADADITPAKLAEAGAVATSISCSVQLVAHASSNSASSSSGHARSRDESDEASSYNKELGVEYVHSPKTGENYEVSPSTDWRQNGPDGPGYYRPVGNSLEKLSSGRSD